MIWLSWRQQRTETVLTAALLTVLAALFVPEAVHLSSAYTQDHVASCVGRQTETCLVAVANFGNNAGVLRSALGWFNLLVGLIGVALAAPLILDLENGASTFVWTQSVPRTRWLATRLGLAVGTALLAGALYTLLFGWYRGPLDAVWGPFSDGAFDVEGIVPLAYVLFALGLGLAVGAVWRRTAPAMIVAFLGYFGARIFVDSWLRQRLVSPIVATWGPHSRGPDLQRAWVLFDQMSNRAGLPFTNIAALQQCMRSAGVKGGVHFLKGPSQACLDRIGAGFTHAVYQPASRFWEFQGIETALFGGLALMLIAFAAWRILRTD